MIAASTKLSALFAAKHDGQPSATHPYDVTLILIALALMSIGIIIVTSASMPVADRLHDNPFYFAIRHGIYIVGAIVAAMVVLNLPMQFWRMTRLLHLDSLWVTGRYRRHSVGSNITRARAAAI